MAIKVELREAGPYAIESYQELGYEQYARPQFFAKSCFVAYGDSNLPSHSVRIFKYED